MNFLDQLLTRCGRETFFAALALGYGAWLWKFQSFQGSSGLRMMNHVAQLAAPEADAEAVWGGVLGAAGILVIIGAVSGSRSLRTSAIATLSALFSLMSWCLWQASPHTPGCVTYALISLLGYTFAYQIFRRKEVPW